MAMLTKPQPFRHTRYAGVSEGSLMAGQLESSPTSWPLSSPYVFGTSGATYAQCFQVIESGTLTAIWVVPASFTGTWGSTDGVINYEIRAGLSATTKPSLTVLASGTIPLTAGVVDTWIKVSGLSLAVTAGDLLTLVIGDADGNATNFVTMRQIARSADTTHVPSIQSTNGWVTPATGGYPAVLAMKVGTKTYCGALTKAAAVQTFAGNTRRRGMRVRWEQPMLLQSVGLISLLTGMSKIEIFSPTQLPSDVPLFSHTLNITNGIQFVGAVALYYIDPTGTQLPLFEAGVDYFLSFKPSVSIATSKIAMFSGMDSDLNTLISGYDNLTLTFIQELAGNVWDEDAGTMISGIQLSFIPYYGTAGGAIMPIQMNGGYSA